MKLTCKMDMSGMLKKIERAKKELEKEADNDLKEYGRVFIDNMLKVTPPNNGRGNMGFAIKKLKERIAGDVSGDVADGGTPWVDEDWRWITLASGEKKLVPVSGHGSRSPFFKVAGRLSPAKMEALKKQYNVGRYHVQYVDSDLGTFMRSVGQYRLRGGRVKYLSWHGPRHLVKAAAIRAEVKRRQMQVGRLVAGWFPMARLCKAKMPGVPKAQQGSAEGRAVKRGSGLAKFVTATNSVPYSPLKNIVKRNERRVQNGIKKRGKFLAEKKRKKLRKL